MNQLLKIPTLLRGSSVASCRRLSNKVPQAQKLFQEPNALPVHVKGGATDVILYRATMALTIGGGIYSLYWLLVASMPRKKA
ncbi:cytochrome c oxidase subunit 7A2, mitochondrial [Corythoichthys intestinalis]|uniref:cytochrome c oxidase subunit 7A2, mitochondrial n=1 Tax=Corythoichthys intestinalis TaxID=161448 RepID=UPI0025A4D077|nr:cytochrome c oxidase subunit 7A2, mitochondrial [Corythoichthys intestinalis]XP_061811961.1 cytochrome c oxidase subunit 7A2, mitochondrial-like [Nerophis lumbriciformis]